ncbi:MAG: AtpZ/AtpI family protein [Bacteroidia bacterium]|nr:AtpZ/AtpI family protein [Bacteroidia bacterium]
MTKKHHPNYYLKYAGIVFQMAAAIFIGIWLGKKVDEYFVLDKPYFMSLGAIIMLAAVFYLIFKDLTNSK